MSDYSLIQELKRNGTLKLYHDYRSRSFLDFSGNGNHGTPTDYEWMNNHIEQEDNSILSRVDVTYNDNLRLQSGGSVIGILHRVTSEATDFIISVTDAGGTQYQIYYTVGGGNFLYIQSGAGSVRSTNALNTAEDFPFNQCYGVTFTGGATPTMYLNGVEIPTTVAAAWPATLYQTADRVRLWNARALGNSCYAPQAALITSTQLTATQHAQLYGELMS